MDLFGARFEEVVGVMNAVATEANDTNGWRLQGEYAIAEGLISGISIRLRQRFVSGTLTAISITGKGWMVNFNVNRREPNNLPADVPRFSPEIVQSNWFGFSHASPGKLVRKFCLHTPSVMSPEEFRTEMTLLRMFSSEWEL